jgi:hypothetical protein
MTAVNDFMHDTPKAIARPVGGPVQVLDGGRMMVRSGQSFLGATLILAAAGLWILPGAEFSSDVMLMKLVLSLTAGCIGIALAQNGKAPTSPEIEIDTARREIRLVRRTGQQTKCVETCKIEDLDRAEVQGAHVLLWAKGDVLLAEVALSDPILRRSLMGALADAGKL